MTRSKNIFIAIILTILIMASCAQFSNPQGGPRDEDPPILIEALSEQNYQTSFVKKPIDLEFNEWIQLSNPVKEIVISPPTNYPLKFTARGKRVRVEFAEEEILKDSVSYQINFGDAIRDFTESNIYKNFVFIFSTGDEIDSLSVAGTVTDAETGKPAKDVLVCLYDNLNDSIITQVQPFYFTRTDNSGRYKLNNIKNDSFQVFTLKDENVNYFYDLMSEKVGFYDDILILNDSSLINIDLELFDEKDEPRLVEYKQEKKGLIKLFFSPNPDSLAFYNIDDSTQYLYHELVGDSVYLWHTDLRSDSSRFLVWFDKQTDTIINRKARESAAGMTLKTDRSMKNIITAHRDDSIAIKMNKPLKSFDISKIELSDTSTVYNLDRIFTNEKSIFIQSDSLAHNSNYSIKIDSGGIVDIYNQVNKDSIVFTLKTNEPESFGNMTLNFINASDTIYTWELLKGNALISKGACASSYSRAFNRISSGTYKLRLVEDLNGDGKWTSGNVVLRRKPERIKEISLEELKPAWDLDLDVVIKEIFYGTAGE
jgi:5-hydroxyisourate hydrolase-like protein (transthyretin family)